MMALIVLLLPMAVAAYMLVGPTMNRGPRYLLQAAFFAALPGPAIALALTRRSRGEWVFVAICVGFAAWSLYKAVEEWGVS
jgi:hypothetical protein